MMMIYNVFVPNSGIEVFKYHHHQEVVRVMLMVKVVKNKNGFLEVIYKNRVEVYKLVRSDTNASIKVTDGPDAYIPELSSEAEDYLKGNGFKNVLTEVD